MLINRLKIDGQRFWKTVFAANTLLGWSLLFLLPSAVALRAFLQYRSRQPQHLPVGAYLISGSRRIELEIARTREEKEKGLQFREPLPDDRGMMFVVDPPSRAAAVTPNMEAAVDVAFLRSGTVLKIAPNVKPCFVRYGAPHSDCEAVYYPHPVDAVLQLRVGTLSELGVHPGSQLILEKRDRSN
ncbi:MAG: DUF192 domain-containing protein [Microcoleus sp.]